MLWARAAQVSQAALAAKRPDGRWARPAESLRSRMASSAGGVRSVVSVGFDYPMAVVFGVVVVLVGFGGRLVQVGDEGVVAPVGP